MSSNREIRCRGCGCTETRPCDPPCSWAEADLCSTCAAFKHQLIEFWEQTGAPVSGLTRIYREVVEAMKRPRRKKAAAK